MRKRTESVLYNVLPKNKYPLENNQLTDIILDYKNSEECPLPLS